MSTDTHRLHAEFRRLFPRSGARSLPEFWDRARAPVELAIQNIEHFAIFYNGRNEVGGNMRRYFGDADHACKAALQTGEDCLRVIQSVILEGPRMTASAAPTSRLAGADASSLLSTRRAEATAALQRAVGPLDIQLHQWALQHERVQARLLHVWNASSVPPELGDTFSSLDDMRAALKLLLQLCGMNVRDAVQAMERKILRSCLVSAEASAGAEVAAAVATSTDTTVDTQTQASVDPVQVRAAVERSSSFAVMRIALLLLQVKCAGTPHTHLADAITSTQKLWEVQLRQKLPLPWKSLMDDIITASACATVIPRHLSLPAAVSVTNEDVRVTIERARACVAAATNSIQATAAFGCPGCLTHNISHFARVTVDQYNMKIDALANVEAALESLRSAISIGILRSCAIASHPSPIETALAEADALLSSQTEELRALDSIIAACSQVCFVSTRYIGCSPAFWTREEYVANTKTFFACLDEVLEGSIRTECGLYDVAQSSGKCTQDVHERLSSSLSTLLKDTRDAVGATLAAKAGNLIEAFRPAMSADACMLLASSPCFDVFSRSVSEITFPAQYEWGRLAASLLEEWMKTLPSVLLCAPAEFKVFETDPAMARRMHDVVALACQLTAWSAIANSDVDLIPAQSSQGLLYDPALHKAWDADSRTRVTKGEIVIALGLLPACRSPSKETSGSVTPTQPTQQLSSVVVGAHSQFPGLRVICLTRGTTAAGAPAATATFSDELVKRSAKVSAATADLLREQRRRDAAAAVSDVAPSTTAASPRPAALASEWESNFSMATWLLAGDVGVSATAHRLRKTREEAASASAEVASSHTRAAGSAETVAATVVPPFQQSDMGFAGLLSFGAQPSQAEPAVDMPRAPSVPSSRSAITAAREAADAAAISARNAQAETRGHGQ